MTLPLQHARGYTADDGVPLIRCCSTSLARVAAAVACLLCMHIAAAVVCLPPAPHTRPRSESSLSMSASDMGEGAAATVRKAKWGRTQVAVKLFRGEPDQIYKELTAEAAILHVRGCPCGA